MMNHAKAVRVVAAATLIAGGVIAATPTMASAVDRGSACSGDVALHKNTYDIAIKVNGITYGHVNVAARYIESIDEMRFDVAVKDSRSDGLAPYVRPAVTTSSGSVLFKSTRVINRRGAASGWVCYSLYAAGHGEPRKLNLYGSVADAPSIPEPVVAGINYANW
jgi:hypothetical protein